MHFCCKLFARTFRIMAFSSVKDIQMLWNILKPFCAKKKKETSALWNHRPYSKNPTAATCVVEFLIKRELIVDASAQPEMRNAFLFSRTSSAKKLRARHAEHGFYILLCFTICSYLISSTCRVRIRAGEFLSTSINEKLVAAWDPENLDCPIRFLILLFFLLPWNKNTNVSCGLYIGFETSSSANFEYVRPKRESVALSTDAFIDHKFAVSCKFHHFVGRVAVNDPYNRLVRSSTFATDWPMCFIKRKKEKPSMFAYQGRCV